MPVSHIAELKAQLAEMAPKEGYAYSSEEIAAVRRSLADYEDKLEPDAWTRLAWDTLRADYDDADYPQEVVEQATRGVLADWKAAGREPEMTADGARTIASAVGNRMYRGGDTFDPTQAVRREPARGLFGRPAEDEA